MGKWGKKICLVKGKVKSDLLFKTNIYTKINNLREILLHLNLVFGGVFLKLSHNRKSENQYYKDKNNIHRLKLALYWWFQQ